MSPRTRTHVFGTCDTCGGRIVFRVGMSTFMVAVWFHLNDEDWTDNPHDAVLRDGTREEVTR